MKNRIQELRHQKGITIQDLGLALSIPQNSLAEYEMGLVPLTDEILLKIAAFFDVPVGYILFAK